MQPSLARRFPDRLEHFERVPCVEEVDEALVYWVCRLQRQITLQQLLSLDHLNLVRDELGLMRAGGRLRHSTITVRC